MVIVSFYPYLKLILIIEISTKQMIKFKINIENAMIARKYVTLYYSSIAKALRSAEKISFAEWNAIANVKMKQFSLKTLQTSR